MSVTDAPRLRLVKSTEVTRDVLLANLRCRDVAAIGETGLSIELLTGEGKTCFVPQPLIGDDSYSQEQLETIESALNTVDIELLPIDYSLTT